MRERLLAFWPTKLWLGAVLGVVFCVGYWAAQRVTLVEPRMLSLSAIDRVVPFSPAWTGVYLSLYAMLPIAWLARSRLELRRYATGLLIIAAIGFSVFMVLPIEGPRVASDHALLNLLQRFDSPRNAMPSLHVALAVYSACFARRVITSRRLRSLFWIWAVLIAYSTLAIRQHYAIDLPPGALLGWAAHRIAWRRSRHPQPLLIPEAA
jgi:membrane-associated phospholipid phosphatase